MQQLVINWIKAIFVHISHPFGDHTLTFVTASSEQSSNLMVYPISPPKMDPLSSATLLATWKIEFTYISMHNLSL